MNNSIYKTDFAEAGEKKYFPPSIPLNIFPCKSNSFLAVNQSFLLFNNHQAGQ
jgi:hypothetical protein